MGTAVRNPLSISEIRDPCAERRRGAHGLRAGAEEAGALREALAFFAQRAARGDLTVHLPNPVGALVSGGRGHFHVQAELFLQLQGRTEFTFPNGALTLRSGQALVVPPQVLHEERVHADGPAAAQAFRNVVVHADAGLLSYHLAHEAVPGLPDILHLEGLRHPEATRIQEWLADAARLGVASPSPWVQAQARALVATALAALMRVIDDAESAPPTPPDPPLLARARMLIQNQLGEHTLSVALLASQCGCTPDHLSHLTRRHLGESVSGLILRLRMERAARLLTDSALSGKEVAWACGFSGASHFIHTFRRQYGMTPQTWRARAAGL